MPRLRLFVYPLALAATCCLAHTAAQPVRRASAYSPNRFRGAYSVPRWQRDTCCRGAFRHALYIEYRGGRTAPTVLPFRRYRDSR